MEENKKKYVNGFYKALILHNAKNFGMLFSAVFAVLVLGVITIPAVAGINGEKPVEAQTQNIVKFAKVEATDRENIMSGGDAGMLTSTANIKDAPNVKKMGDSLTAIDMSADVPVSEGIVKDDTPGIRQPYLDKTDEYMLNDRSLEEFYVYTSCSANVRGEPAKGDNIITVKAMGNKFTVVGENGDWYKIKWGDDGYAYISKTCVADKKP